MVRQVESTPAGLSSLGGQIRAGRERQHHPINVIFQPRRGDMVISDQIDPNRQRAVIQDSVKSITLGPDVNP